MVLKQNLSKNLPSIYLLNIIIAFQFEFPIGHTLQPSTLIISVNALFEEEEQQFYLWIKLKFWALNLLELLSFSG